VNDPGSEAAHRIARATGAEVTGLRLTGSGHRWRHYRADLAGGRAAFAKVAAGDAGGVFGAEARGLRWLSAAGAVPVPDVLGWDETTLVVSWVAAGQPSRQAAGRFGQELARMHQAGADTFGAPWHGYIASLFLPNDREVAGRAPCAGPPPWLDWYAAHRVRPYLRQAVDAGVMTTSDAAVVESALAQAAALAGPPEPASRIHGDCWSGNVLWADGRCWLIDPAAHGGHRETDLAMLALFGAPYLDRILAAYQDVAPLAAGWRARVPLHQLHPLLVHACLFGAAYRQPVLDAARALLTVG
jgi:fructosamine-3-kinase